MNRLPRFTLWISLAIAAALCVAGLHLMLTPTIPAVSAAVAAAQDQAPPDQGQDPAAVNTAPSGPSYTTQAPPPPDQAGAAPGPDDQDYAEQPTETADQPPPPLPDYEQPPPPGDGYIWTPGYWGWGPAGYYWVPGAWVEAPYMGALWTPGYWGFYGSRYMFYPGHWGLHIGFYGGINYGFGYMGFGYEGGYWNSGRFFYNRAYNHINERVVHNVYEYHAPARGYNAPRGNYDQHNNAPRGNYDSHASYRGGPGGVQSRPQPSEGAAWQEPTAPRMSSQERHAQNYQSNRGQSAAHNNGQPHTPSVSKPVRADHNVHPTVRAQSHNNGGGRH
jgi:hypothetical protein